MSVHPKIQDDSISYSRLVTSHKTKQRAWQIFFCLGPSITLLLFGETSMLGLFCSTHSQKHNCILEYSCDEFTKDGRSVCDTCWRGLAPRANATDVLIWHFLHSSVKARNTPPQLHKLEEQLQYTRFCDVLYVCIWVGIFWYRQSGIADIDWMLLCHCHFFQSLTLSRKIYDEIRAKKKKKWSIFCW